MKEMRWTRHVACIGEKKSGIFSEKTQRNYSFWKTEGQARG
jgi:hypothetical protein